MSMPTLPLANNVKMTYHVPRKGKPSDNVTGTTIITTNWSPACVYLVMNEGITLLYRIWGINICTPHTQDYSCE
jgi:hypothetical protein